MKRLAWSPLLVVLIACGGKAEQPADTAGVGGTGGSGGSKTAQQAGGGQGGTGGSLAIDGSAMGGDRSSGDTDAAAPSANADSGDSGGASGEAGKDADRGVDEGGIVSKDGGRDSEAGGPSGAFITPEVLVPIANAFCAAARSCCMKDGIRPALDNCESQYAWEPTAQGLVNGTMTVDSAGLASCLAAYQAASETCDAKPVIAACRGLVHGTLAEGQPCRFDSECAGVEPMVCLLPDEHGAGVCKKIVHAKAGDGCVLHCRPDGKCLLLSYAPADAAAMGCFEAEGVYCDRSANTLKCSPVRATGAACTDSEQCGSALSQCDIKTRKCKLFTLDGPYRFSGGGACGGSSYGP